MTLLIHIDYDVETTNLGGEDPDDRWSRDSTRSTYEVTGAWIGDGKRGDCPITYCEPGDKIYVVWADYTTGDSFGSDSSIEFLAAFKNRSRAEACKRRADEKNGYEDGWDIDVFLDGEESYRVHIPWLGYFEHLNSVNITEVVVK